MAACVVIYLEDFRAVESAHQPVIPFALSPLGKRHLDLNRIGGRWLRATVLKVKVECLEDGAASRTEVPKAELQRVEHRGLAAVVLADQDRNRLQLEVEVLDAAEIPDSDFGDGHGILGDVG